MLVTDREEPVPGYGAGDAPGCPPEGPGREGRIWRTGGFLGAAPDIGEDGDQRSQVIFGFRGAIVQPFLSAVLCKLCFLSFCRLPPHTESSELPGQ